MAFRRSLIMAAAVLGMLPAAARANISIGATPAFLDITLDAGKTTAQTILLFNSGTDPVTVRAYAWDWWHQGGEGRVFAPPGTLPHTAAKWVTFTPSEITINPQKAANVTVVFSTPPEAKGGNYAVAWFEAIPEANPDAKELRVGARLGVLLMTEVRGTSHANVDVDDLKISPPTASQVLKADLTLVNSGDVHLFPKGTLVVTDKDHQLVGHVGFEKRRMLPGEKSAVTLKWGGDLDPGEYQAVLTVDYGEAGATVKTATFVVPGGSGE